MRTTLTLDPDVARLLREEVHRRRRPLKQVVNDALRRGLAARGSASGSTRRRRFHVRTFDVGRLLPGIDPGHLNALADELEERALVSKLRRAKGK